MTDVPPSRQQIQIEESRFRYALAESLTQKLGGSINFINTAQYQEKSFYANGLYNITGQNETAFDGLFVFPNNAQIFFVTMFNIVAGSAGSTSIDVKRAPTGSNVFTSIFSTPPAISFSAGAFARISTGGSGSGLTAPVLTATPFLITAGDAIRVDFLSKQTGGPQNCGLNIIFQPR